MSAASGSSVERSARNFDKLAARVGTFKPKPTLLQGPFQDHAAAIANTIGDAPALLMLDPIGVKALDYETCAPLLTGAGKTDVCVIVASQVVHRTAGQLLPDGMPDPAIAVAEANAGNIDNFFGTPGRRSIAADPAFATRRERRWILCPSEDRTWVRERSVPGGAT